MPKRTRERQLAMLAARRQAERARQRRRRNLILGAVGIMAAAVLLVVGIRVLTRSSPTVAAASITPTPTSSPQPSPCGTPTAPPGGKKPTFKEAPPMTIDTSKTYTATFKTSCGTFTAQLLPKIAPVSVNSFVFLANKGFYDGLTFHRIVAGFAIQGGDPLGTGTGGPGYSTPITVDKSQTFDAAGLLAFAHGSTGGNGSQFFFTLSPQPSLDPPQGKYTIFGKVTKGLDIVKKIGTVPTVAGPGGEQSQPTTPVYIDKVTITEK